MAGYDDVLGKIVNRYEFIEYLGPGECGSAYKCKKDQDFFILKYIDDEWCRNNELKVHTKVKDKDYGKNVVKLYGSVELDGKVYLKSEFVDGPNLNEFLGNVGYIDVENMDNWINMLKITVEKLHADDIIHGDICC